MKFFLLAFALAFNPFVISAKKVPTPDRLNLNGGPRPLLRPFPNRGPDGGGKRDGTPTWSSHQHVFTGTLKKVVAGPVGRSFPPMFTHKLTFTVKEVMRGDLKPGDLSLIHI